MKISNDDTKRTDGKKQNIYTSPVSVLEDFLKEF